MFPAQNTQASATGNSVADTIERMCDPASKPIRIISTFALAGPYWPQTTAKKLAEYERVIMELMQEGDDA